MGFYADGYRGKVSFAGVFLWEKGYQYIFMQIQEQDDFVSSWSDSTIKKIRQVLIKILVENGYLDHIKSEHL